MIKEITAGRKFIGKLRKGKDLLDELTEVCRANKIKLGKVTAIGAVQSAVIAYYHQDTKIYETLDLAGHLEILSLVGNISLKDDAPIVHAHATFGDGEGRAFGGHLVPGSIIFACEFIIEEFKGTTLERGYDEPTGLPLWRD